MSNLRAKTVEVYDASAKEFSKHFRSRSARIEDIELALKLAGNPTCASVVEIGCGDGRDATEITKRVKTYHGFDISEKLIELAKQSVPQGNFAVADAVAYEFPENLDIVFAFASMLHLDKREFASVLEHAYKALKPAGIFYISLKYAPRYKKLIKQDQYGERLFYLYNVKTILRLASKNYQAVFTEHKQYDVAWFNIALQKL